MNLKIEYLVNDNERKERGKLERVPILVLHPRRRSSLATRSH